jgi:hypothetical protein
MHPTPPKLTDEMREALDRQPGGPIEIEDDRTKAVYVLVDREAFGKLVDDTLREALQVGLGQSARGESDPWDVNAFLAKAHARHARRSS